MAMLLSTLEKFLRTPMLATLKLVPIECVRLMFADAVI